MVSDKDTYLAHNIPGSDPPRNALVIAFPEATPYYLVVARSKFGQFPGFSKGNEAFYAFAGKEHTTRDFDWIVISESAPDWPIRSCV